MPVNRKLVYINPLAIVSETCSGSWTFRRYPEFYEDTVGHCRCQVCGRIVTMSKPGNQNGADWLILEHLRNSPEQPAEIWVRPPRKRRKPGGS